MIDQFTLIVDDEDTAFGFVMITGRETPVPGVFRRIAPGLWRNETIDAEIKWNRRVNATEKR